MIRLICPVRMPTITFAALAAFAAFPVITTPLAGQSAKGARVEAASLRKHIDYNSLARVANLARDFARTIASLDHRPRLDSPKTDPNTTCRQYNPGVPWVAALPLPGTDRHG